MKKIPYVTKYKVKSGRIIVGVYDPVFRSNVWVIYNFSLENTIKHINKTFACDFKAEDHKKAGGVAFKIPLRKGKSRELTDLTVIWLQGKDVTSLAHEILHHVFWILYLRGVSLSEFSEETFTYLHTYFLHNVLEVW